MKALMIVVGVVVLVAAGVAFLRSPRLLVWVRHD